MQRGRDQVDLVATKTSARVVGQLRDVASTSDVRATAITRRLLRTAEDIQNVRRYRRQLISDLSLRFNSANSAFHPPGVGEMSIRFSWKGKGRYGSFRLRIECVGVQVKL